MKSIIVDFSKIYIGTIAKQGEHNRAQLVFALPDDFAGADYVNAEFKKSDNSVVVIEGFIPKDGFVTIPLTQGLTNVCDQIDIQLVAYAVDGAEITEIAKSLTVRGVIRPSLNILFNHDEPGIIERVIAFISYWAEKLPEMLAKKHWHDNKALLDTITSETLEGEQADWNENDTTKKSFVKNRTHWVEYGDTEDVSYIFDNSNASWEYNGESSSENYAYNLTDGGTYKITLQGIEYSFVAGVAKQITDGTYMGVEHVTMTRIAIGNMKMAAVEDLRNASSAYESGDFKMCFTYEIVTVDNDTTAKSEIGTVMHTGHDSEVDADTVAFTITPVTYHKLNSNYLPDEVNDAALKKHTHVNKDLLDSLTADDVGIKPDWGENDEESKNHIANRTHWSEEEQVTTDYTVEWVGTTPTYQAQPWAADDLGITLNEGETYTLQVGGETTTDVCKKLTMTDQGFTQDYYYIGNLHIFDPSAEDTGFPMLLVLDKMWQNGEIIRTWNLVLTYDTLFGNGLPFSVEKTETVYHPLSMNYMPDGVEDSVEKKHAHDNKQEIDKIGVTKTHGGSYGFDVVTYNNRPISQYSLWTLSSDGNGVVEGSLYAGDITTVLAVFGEPIVSITITELMNPLHIISEYNLHFTSGAAAPTVVLPASVQWVVEPTFEKYKHYQISIVDNVALWCAVDIEAKEEES